MLDADSAFGGGGDDEAEDDGWADDGDAARGAPPGGGGADMAEALPRVAGAAVRELLRGAALCRWPLAAGDELFDHALWLRVKEAQWPWLARCDVSRAVLGKLGRWDEALAAYAMGPGYTGSFATDRPLSPSESAITTLLLRSTRQISVRLLLYNWSQDGFSTALNLK